MCKAIWHAVASFLLLPAGAVAQRQPGQSLPDLIRANERFGRKLLSVAHQASPQRNSIVSPVSLTLILGAMQESSDDRELSDQMDQVFGWSTYPSLGIPARMLLAAFERPEDARRARWKVSNSPEECWVSNVVLYRSRYGSSKKHLQVLDGHFAEFAGRYFGMKFVDTRSRKPVALTPHTSGKNDILLTSATHLRTAWRPNTFTLNDPFQGHFRAATGEEKPVQMMTSQLDLYRHVSTPLFEAVAIPGEYAEMIAMLPANGVGIEAVEQELATDPESLDSAMHSELGQVIFPQFRIQLENDLRPPLERLGIRRIFRDLGNLVQVEGSRVTEVRQSIDFEVDQQGMRASANTVMGIVVGGIGDGKNPFRMVFDRPFLFLVRERHTNALLFLAR